MFQPSTRRSMVIGEGAPPGVASGDQVDKKVDVFCDDDPGLAGRVSWVNYFAFGIVGVVRRTI